MKLRGLWALKAGLTLLAAYLILRKVDVIESLPLMWKCGWGFLFLNVVCQYSVGYLNAWRWRMLWPVEGLPLRKYLFFVFVGHFFNFFLPSAAAAEGVKVLAFGRKYGNIQENMGLVLLARALGVLFQFGLAAVGVWCFRGEFSELRIFQRLHVEATHAYLLAGAVALSLALAWIYRGAWRERRWATAIAKVVADRPLLIRTAGVTFLIQIVSAVGVYALFLSLYPEVRLWQVLLLPAIIQTILILPISFGGIGVREYLNLVFYSDFAGIPRETVFALSVLGYFPLLLLAVTGGVWMGFRKFSGKI